MLPYVFRYQWTRARRAVFGAGGVAAIACLASVGAQAGEPAHDASTPAAFRTIARLEAEKAGLPAEVADAVMAIESGYHPDRIGGVGEIGLMQVRPGTAAMLGFKGTAAELAVPQTNIHYGVTYLAGAWRRAGGDLCRTLMKYRAGHGEEVMTPLSVTYCMRARDHLEAAGSPLGKGPVPLASAGTQPARIASASVGKPARRLRGTAFWAAHDARIRIITARIERRWRQMAAR